jgi:DNA polymerase III alpha subunit
MSNLTYWTLLLDKSQDIDTILPVDNCIPLFKSHYSIGRSILTLNPPGDDKKNTPTSIFDILKKNKIKEFFLVENSMSGFLEAYKNSEDNGIKLNFGLRLNFLCDVEEKNEEALKSRCKYIIFAKNTEGYKKLIRIWSFAAKEGFYYTPNLDFKTLRDFWSNDDLLMCVPFYDSFLHRNTLEGAVCIPDFEYCKPILFVEDNDVPFDHLIKERALSYAESSGLSIQKTKSIYYRNREDFLAYLTFRCINNRSTLERPNIDHMCSNEFCFESWKENGR